MKPHTVILSTLLFSLLILLLLVVVVLYYITAMPGSSHRGPLPALTSEEKDIAARLRQHVVAIASKEHNVAQQ